VSSQTGLLSPLADTDASGQADGFLAAVAERLGSYVYLFIDPRDGRIFHVGTGTGDRCFRHLAEAHDDLPLISEIEDAGHRVRIDILRHGLSPETAASVAAAVIDVLGSDDLGTDQREASPAGRMSVGDLNARYGAKPVTIRPEHPVVLIRIPRAGRRGTDRHCYELTRGWWLADARRENAKWAFAVDEGVVRAVYRIDAWEPARAGNRWGFRGPRDPAMEQEYRHGDVSDYLLADRQNALTYVNC
jgi:uncharacterized protein